MLQYAHKHCAILNVCWHRVRISYFAGDVVHAIFAYAIAANLLVACGGSQHRGLRVYTLLDVHAVTLGGTSSTQPWSADSNGRKRVHISIRWQEHSHVAWLTQQIFLTYKPLPRGVSKQKLPPWTTSALTGHNIKEA